MVRSSASARSLTAECSSTGILTMSCCWSDSEFRAIVPLTFDVESGVRPTVRLTRSDVVDPVQRIRCDASANSPSTRPKGTPTLGNGTAPAKCEGRTKHSDPKARRAFATRHCSREFKLAWLSWNCCVVPTGRRYSYGSSQNPQLRRTHKAWRLPRGAVLLPAPTASVVAM